MANIKIVTEIPGPLSREMVARREKSTANGMAKLTQLGIKSAKGSVVTDVDGNELIDFAGGIGMLAVGHNHEDVVSALHQQVDELIHLCAIVGTYEPYVQVAELLNEITPGSFEKKSILLNSGAEAIETAVKISRAYTKRQGIIVFEGAYHGRTNLTMGMTSKYALFKKGFGPFAPEIYRVPFPNLYRKPDGLSDEEYIEYMIQQFNNALIAYIDPGSVAAIVIEPVQGEGGFLPVPPRFLQRIREVCDEHGIVMVADEIQCGFGRTGKLFAVEHYGIVPDLIATGKSLAAGTPLAAVTGRAEMMDAPHPGGLGGTYSGSPLSCAAAIASIRTINHPEFLKRAVEVGQTIRQTLNALYSEIDYVGDVRGLGPMLAIELVKDRESKTPFPEFTAAINQETLQRGLITIRAGLYSNCVRFLPPLNITRDELNEGLSVFKESVLTCYRQQKSL